MDSIMFSEPSSVSSRDFITQSYSQPSSEGIDYWTGPSTSTRLEISGQSQNSLILPRTLRFCYSAMSLVQTLPDGSPSTPPAINQVQAMDGVSDLKFHPGTPFFGAPHVGSINCEVPGLSSNFSALERDGQSQRWYAQRLLCSGDEGSCAAPGMKSSYFAKGRAFSAGARDLVTRASNVHGSYWRGLFGGTVVRDFTIGGIHQYEVPAAAWFSLCDGASSVLPLPYLTSSSSNLVVRVNWAPASSALVGLTDKTRAADLISYVTVGHSLEWTAVNVINAEILASLQSLYRGMVSIPIAEGVSVPVPMTMSHRAFRFASTTLSSSSGVVSLRVPAGQACCEAILLKIDGRPNEYASPVATHNVTSPKAMIQNLVLRIGSARFPAREISDIYVGTGQIPRNLGSAKWALTVTDPVASQNNNIGGATYVNLSDSRALEMYRQGRQFFSVFDNDKYDAAPASELFVSHGGPSSASDKLTGSSAIPVGMPVIANVGQPWRSSPFSVATDSLVVDTRGGDEATYSPNLFLFPLSSVLAEDSLRQRGYSCNGIDLRNQSDVLLEFSILGAAPTGTNLTGGNWVPDIRQWEISAALEYREFATILPGRTDLQASSSLIPSAAGSIATGGAQ